MQPTRAKIQSVTYSNFEISHEEPLSQKSADSSLTVSCPCLGFVRTNRGQSLSSNSRICPVSDRCLDFLSGACLSGLCLSRFCRLSEVGPDFRKKRHVVCLSDRTRKIQPDLPDFHCPCPPMSALSKIINRCILPMKLDIHKSNKCELQSL